MSEFKPILKFDMQFKLDVLREALRDLESSGSDTEPEYPTSDNHDDYYTAGYEQALFEVSKVARRALEVIGDERV